MVVVLHEGEPRQVPEGIGTDGQLWIPAADVERVCGWSWRNDRLWQGDAAVPVPATTDETFVRAGSVNLAACWRHLDKPALAAESGDVWVLGAAAEERARALQTLQAPDFTLPDLDGKLHSLSDYRGSKVYLVSWASW